MVALFVLLIPIPASTTVPIKVLVFAVRDSPAAGDVIVITGAAVSL